VNYDRYEDFVPGCDGALECGCWAAGCEEAPEPGEGFCATCIEYGGLEGPCEAHAELSDDRI